MDSRFPAEWEPQSGVILAWPHAGTDWAPRLPEVEQAYVGLVSAVARFEPVLLCVADAGIEARARALLDGRVGVERVHRLDAELAVEAPVPHEAEPSAAVPVVPQSNDASTSAEITRKKLK